MATKPGEADAFDHPAIAIRCTQPGFRRAGIAHPAVATYPAGQFTAEQMGALQAEPRLVIGPAAEPKA